MKLFIEILVDGVFKILCFCCKIVVNWLVFWLKNVIYYDKSSIVSICIYFYVFLF